MLRITGLFVTFSSAVNCVKSALELLMYSRKNFFRIQFIDIIVSRLYLSTLEMIISSHTIFELARHQRRLPNKIQFSRPVKRFHDDVIKWKHFPRYWAFVRGIHRSPVNSPHRGQWRGALMFSLICAWINAWINSREAGDLRRHRANCDVIVMCSYHDIVLTHMFW